MTLTPGDLARAEAFGRLAAQKNLRVDTCPYEANGDNDQRVLAARFVAAYLDAGGTIEVDYDDGAGHRGGAPRWTTVKTRHGLARVARVRPQ